MIGPAWLEQVVAAVVDGQEPATARDWVAGIRAHLVRLDGRVPFTVVHDWHADTVTSLLADVCEGQRVVGALHASALAGSPVEAARWRAALEPALRDLYHLAYPYDDAYQANYDSAEVYGTAHGFGAEGTREYAVYYAELATGANRKACADANAIANAHACAAAFAAADPAAYALTYPDAAARAYASAAANAGASAVANAGASAVANAGASAVANAGGSAVANPGGCAAANAAGCAVANVAGGTDRAERERAAHAALAAGLAAALARAAGEPDAPDPGLRYGHQLF